MVFFVEIPLFSLAVLTGGNVAVGLSLASPPDAGLTWGEAGQMGGPEQHASLADVALTCILTADKPLSVRLHTARQCVPVVGVSEGSLVTQSAVEVQSWVGSVTL